MSQQSNFGSSREIGLALRGNLGVAWWWRRSSRRVPLRLRQPTFLCLFGAAADAPEAEGVVGGLVLVGEELLDLLGFELRLRLWLRDRLGFGLLGLLVLLLVLVLVLVFFLVLVLGLGALLGLLGRLSFLCFSCRVLLCLASCLLLCFLSSLLRLGSSLLLGPLGRILGKPVEFFRVLLGQLALLELLLRGPRPSQVARHR